jgi:predicted transcriptional regulator YdeE
VSSTIFHAPPGRIERSDVIVMLRATVDDLPRIQKIWPAFESLVGLRGRKMFACVDVEQNTYTVCTPIREEDTPDEFGLELGTLPGGSYLRGSLIGEPPEVYGRIGTGMAELVAAAAEVDRSRPLVEYYRRRNHIELWVPIVD